MMKTKLHKEQQQFIDKVLTSDEQYHLLLGGAGTGKTTVVSELMAEFLNQGYRILSLYPTHQSKSVGIERLRDTVGNITVYGAVDDEDKDNARVYVNGSDFAEFRTIHSILGLKPYRKQGSTVQTLIQDAGTFVTNVEFIRNMCDQRSLICFIDEVSMIPLPFITDVEKDESHKTITMGGVVELLDNSGVTYKMVFTGDFNQLLPVRAPMKEFAEEFMTSSVDCHTLLVNHRSSSQEIVKLGEAGFKQRGALPRTVDHDSITWIEEDEDFYERYLKSLKDGRDTVALVYTNRTRKFYENMASVELMGEPNPIFVGNTVLSGSTIPMKTAEGKSETAIFAQDRLKIIRKTEPFVIENTEWSEHSFSAPMVTVERLMDGAMYTMFGVMSIGDTVSPEFREYAKDVSLVYRTIDKFLLNEPEHEFEDLIHKVTSVIPGADKIFDDNYDLFTEGSRMKAYYNKHWSFMGDWNPQTAAGEVAAYIWGKYYYGVESMILPLKTEVSQTCHMAQGSGRDHVFIDMKDIRRCRDREERRRLVYVACTRAKESLTILG